LLNSSSQRRLGDGLRRSRKRALRYGLLTKTQHCNREDTHRSEFWNPSSLAYQFLAEARRLWEAEASQPGLATIQATTILSGLCNMNGADQLGYSYLKQAVEMASDIKLFDQSDISISRAGDARIFTAWMLYAWQG
jgi:hypothetical protein